MGPLVRVKRVLEDPHENIKTGIFDRPTPKVHLALR
jgi:hypothetical protein